MLRSIKSLGIIQRNIPLQPFVRFSSFESDLSLKNLYPNSRQDLHTPPPPPPVSPKFIFEIDEMNVSVEKAFSSLTMYWSKIHAISL